NGTNGQALIKALNGSKYATSLGNWLATTFPNIYGSSAGSNNMSGKSNLQVATYFQSLFSVTGMKLNAQVLATALAVYATDSDLAGGSMATSYGFAVNSSGTGVATFNIGSNGIAFGVTDYSSMTIMNILQATNTKARYGKLWDTDASGSYSAYESMLRDLGN